MALEQLALLGPADPLGNVDGVVAYALQILVNHEEVYEGLALLLRDIGLDDLLDEILADEAEPGVHGIVILDDELCVLDVAVKKGVDGAADHGHDVLTHRVYGLLNIGGLAGDEGGELGYVGRLIANTLHIIDDVQGGGDMAEIRSDGGLEQQKPQAEVLNVLILTVYLGLYLRCADGELLVTVHEGLDCGGNGLLAQGAHLIDLLMQLLELRIEFVSHFISSLIRMLMYGKEASNRKQ